MCRLHQLTACLSGVYEIVIVTLQTYPDTIAALYNRVLERVEQESANHS